MMKNELEDLILTLKKLRSPNGCDWDKSQTHKSLIPYLLEETYEVIEAIQENNMELLKEELGDLLLHIIFQAELASENNFFNIYDSINNINKKLITRHPYVFNNKSEISHKKDNWESAKQKEKNRKSVLEGVPKILPALTRARRIQEKAAGVGFDWNKLIQVKNKIYEELNELEEALETKNKDKIEDELGDVYFSLVNLSRHINTDPEFALNRSTNKFISRFHKIEGYMKENNLKFDEQSLEDLDKIWKKIKLSD
jgi:tetrapyrrole methylase family protein/MazG family protein